MNEQFKPAHQVIAEYIKRLAGNLTIVEGKIAQGGVTIGGGRQHISAEELYVLSRQELGGFCTLLKVLKEMAMPPKALEETLAELKKVTYVHAVLSGAIETLEKRLTATPVSAN